MEITTTSIVFTGDISFDKYMNLRFNDKKLLSDEIKDFLNSADHVAVNLEGALYAPKDLADKTDYYHTMDPASIVLLKSINANIWCIANNHIMDAGYEGIVATKITAKSNCCKTIGAGLNEREASKPVYLGDNIGGIGIICVGYQNECIRATKDTPGCFSWDNFELISERIAEIKSKCRWCVVVSHGGEEFSPIPLPYTRERYIKYLELGADVVVGHHPHVPENYELFENGKMIFYSLGNFIFDTDYQRVHKYTDIGVLLKLKFTNEHITFEALGTRILRSSEKIIACDLPDIFDNISSDEYEILAPLGTKAFIEEDKRKMIYLYPNKYNESISCNWDDYFLKHSHEDYVKGSHMDFDILLPLSREAERNEWKKSKLLQIKKYILDLL